MNNHTYFETSISPYLRASPNKHRTLKLQNQISRRLLEEIRYIYFESSSIMFFQTKISLVNKILMLFMSFRRNRLIMTNYKYSDTRGFFFYFCCWPLFFHLRQHGNFSPHCWYSLDNSETVKAVNLVFCSIQ